MRKAPKELRHSLHFEVTFKEAITSTEARKIFNTILDDIMKSSRHMLPIKNISRVHNKRASINKILRERALGTL